MDEGFILISGVPTKSELKKIMKIHKGYKIPTFIEAIKLQREGIIKRNGEKILVKSF